MTDAADLIAAIIADPSNDLPRLIYADFLDDRGEHERASHIRDTVAGNYKYDRWGGSDIKELLGKTIAEITGKPGDDEVRITLVTGEKFSMYYEPD